MLVDLLMFVAVAAPVMGGLLGGALWLTRAKPRQTNMVLLGAAAGEAELAVWTEALERHGIRCHVVSLSTPTLRVLPTGPYAYEVWVRAKDEARARAVLGL